MAGKKWSDEEIQYLKDNFQDKTCAEIAVDLNRTTKAVQHTFGALGLERSRPEVGDVINGWKILAIDILKSI